MANSHDDPIYPVGERITFFRKQKNLTVNKLANLSGVSQSYLREIELGSKNPTVEILALLCQALGISLRDFFDDDSETLIQSDPLIQRIYRLSPAQREALLVFLNTMTE